MATQQSLDQAQLLYVAYYGRPADFTGQQFWADQIDNSPNGVYDIMDAFGTSPEFDARFGSLTNNQLITNLYQQMFGRDPELGGLNFWVNELVTGNKSLAEIAFAIAEAAGGQDAVALANKVAVAQEFTDSLDTAQEINAYDGTFAANEARDFLAQVDENTDPSSVDVDAFINTLVAGPPVPGVTTVLTPQQDIVPGTAGDDDIRGTQDTLQNGDDIDGAGGNDQLSLAVAQGSGAFFTAPTVSNVETIQVNGPNLLAGDSITFDLSNSDGYNTLESFQTTEGGLPSAVQNQAATQANATVTFRDIQNVNGTDLRIIDTNLNHRYTYDTNAYQTLFGGDDDVMDLYLQEVDGSTITLQNVTGIQNTPGGNQRSHVDQVNITSDERTQVNTTPDNYVWDLNVGPVFNELFIDGMADLEIEKFLDEGVRLVDATALEADLALDLLGHGAITPARALIDPLVVLGAQGDDRIDVRGEFAGGQEVRGTNGFYSLGTGDDLLRVGNSSDEAYFAEHTIGHNVVDSGPGSDTVVLNARGLQNVTTGEGNDTVYINGDVDDLRTPVPGDGTSTVDTGDGDDTVRINGSVSDGQTDQTDYASDTGLNGQGDYEITLGDGEDDLVMNVDGDQLIRAGADDDFVQINGDGVHDIELGTGDDVLEIFGSRLPNNNIDNTIEDLQTRIVAGEGDDDVTVWGDHFLNVELNEGDDRLELLADELTVDDVIDGGEGRDTLSLRNFTSGIVTTGISETSSTSSIEVFDLWDSAQVLELSSDNFDTAENKHITVKTTNSFTDELAELTLKSTGEKVAFTQGMSRAEYNQIRENWEDGLYVEYPTGGNASLEDWLIGFEPPGTANNQNPVDAVDFADRDTSGENPPTFDTIYDEVSDTVFASDDPDADQVNFLTEPGTQTVDITGIPLSVISGRGFKLEGGNVRDIVIADDAAISSRLELSYDNTAGDAQSTQDTLRVIDKATITAADLRNVTGLEIIELQANLQSAQTWNIELNDRVVNQTTGSSDFVIRIDPEVAAGSRVNIQLDPSTINANSNVRIETNGNVDIYINNSLVTEPQYGVDLSLTGSTYSVVVNPALLFTSNADSLVGTSGNDIFRAASVDQVQQADSVDGLANRDTVQLDFAISNPADSLMAQLENPSFTSIEEITFETGNNVQMDGLGAVPGSLDTVTTGYGNDLLDDMDKGYTYNLRRGDDTISLAAGFGLTTIDGGAGEDTVNGTDNFPFYAGVDVLDVTDVETVNLFDGDDTVTIAQNVDNGDITVNGGVGAGFFNSSNDTVNVSGAIGGTVFANNVETVNDSNSANTIDANGQGNASVTVNGNGGDDDITVTNTTTATVNAGSGNDTVEVSNVTTATVNGGSDDDDLTVFNATTANVNGDGGDDTINVSLTGTVNVTGGSGDDDITVLTDNAVSETSTITGGVGNDDITLSDQAYDNGNGGADTIVFGDVIYDVNQVQVANTQTAGLASDDANLDTITNFNFELNGPGAEDILDFTSFGGVNDTAIQHSDWRSGPQGVLDSTGSVAALAVNDGFELDASHIDVNPANGVTIADNGQGVVIAGMDTGGIAGFDSFDVYYVQDIDQDAGQVWQVDLVANIESITDIGVITSIDTANIA